MCIRDSPKAGQIGVGAFTFEQQGYFFPEFRIIAAFLKKKGVHVHGAQIPGLIEKLLETPPPLSLIHIFPFDEGTVGRR